MPVEFISPVTPESCRSKIGKPVCVVLQDGSRYYGFLQAALADRLLLAAKPESDGVQTGQYPKTASLRTNAHFPHPRYGYPGVAFTLPLDRVALMFHLPFLLF